MDVIYHSFSKVVCKFFSGNTKQKILSCLQKHCNADYIHTLMFLLIKGQSANVQSLFTAQLIYS